VYKRQTLHEIYKSFENINYRLEHYELMAADYGTPQKRRRIVFIASREPCHIGVPCRTHAAGPNLFNFPIYIGAGASISHLPPPNYI
jgi:DNA (cytosine-5)-methyltransferase 1